MKDNLMILGGEEWCSLPDLQIPAVRARVDSGARTSAIHANNIREFTKNGERWVSFEIHPITENRRLVVINEAPCVDIRKVKNTGGVAERRYVIRTTLMIGEHSFEIELTLARRDSMGFRMLLGREAMNRRFMVNPAAKYLISQYENEDLKKLYAHGIEKKSNLKIALLASNPELYSNKRLIEAGEERGHEMIFMNMDYCYMKLDGTKPQVYYRGGQPVEDLDAVIPRIKPAITHYGSALLFASNGIPLPLSGFAKSIQDTKGLIEMVGGAPLIVKLLESAQGRGVVLAETNKAAESVINAFKALKANILVQEFIKESAGKDLRCFVVNNKVVAAMERVGAKGEFRANLHQGGEARLAKLTSEEKKIAVKAAKLLGLVVAGVDILRSDRGPLVLEVNSSPGLQGIEEATGKDVAAEIILAAEKVIGVDKKDATEKLGEDDRANQEELFCLDLAAMSPPGRALSKVLNEETSFNVLACYKNGLDFKTALIAGDPIPDVVLMDINMPVMNGVETSRYLKDEHPSVKVIALTMEDNEKDIQAMIREGAKGYLLKDSHPDMLKEAIKIVFDNGNFYPEYVTNVLVRMNRV
ncbi:unnamed protein product, partial [Cyprideis torosa]